MTGSFVSVLNVRFRWRRHYPLVLDIESFEMGEGERIFIKGPSGSGKTTLLNLLGGVMLPETGQISILDTDIVAMSGSCRDIFRAEHIGFIFQMFNLVPYLSLVENVVLPCRFSAARRQRALRQSSTLEEEARRILGHMGLDADDFASRSVSRLSVGEQQRVAAARSLIGAPELVIADEPTSSLDSDVRQSFLDLLFRETGETGSALLFVSHDDSLAGAFDRTIQLGDINEANRKSM